MYRKPKFLEVLHTIREEMSREADYDMELFAEMVRTGKPPARGRRVFVRGAKTYAPLADEGQEFEPRVESNYTERVKRKVRS